MSDEAHALDTVPAAFARSADGRAIAHFATGDGPGAVLLANGLGGRFYSFGPLVRELRRDHTLATWDYRGLFASAGPLATRFQDHVDDGLAVLDARGIDRAAVVGWSMGVGVALELARQHPDRVSGLVLLNGAPGRYLDTLLHPWLPLPFTHRAAKLGLQAALGSGLLSRLVNRVAQHAPLPLALLDGAATGAAVQDIRALCTHYVRDVFVPDMLPPFLRTLIALGEHEPHPALGTIEAPTLVVSGGLDLLTPALRARALVQSLPHATHLHLPRASHFSLVEMPTVVVPAVARFVRAQTQSSAATRSA